MYRMSLVLSCLSLLGAASASEQSTYENFPAPAGFSVVGAGLPDGRLVLWNGEEVFTQSAPDADAFVSIASGYAGDPAFLAVAPNGTDLAMGAGGFGADPYLGDIYGFDLSTPVDFPPGIVELNRNHFAAAFLTNDLLIIDAGVFPNSELAIVDLSAKSAQRAPVAVVRKPEPKAVVVDPKPGFSASVAYDPDTDRVYAMDSNTRELRYFGATDLIDAFNTSGTLDWTTDGTLVGSAGVYYSGGVAGITAAGDLIIGGSEGFGLPGGVQLVDPDNGTLLNTVDPAGDQGFAQVIHNPANSEVVVQQSGSVFSLSESDLEPATGPTPGLPVANLYTLGMLALGMGLVMLKKARR